MTLVLLSHRNVQTRILTETLLTTDCLGAVDDCRCWEKRINYAGGDLRIRNNPSQVQ